MYIYNSAHQGLLRHRQPLLRADSRDAGAGRLPDAGRCQRARGRVPDADSGGAVQPLRLRGVGRGLCAGRARQGGLSARAAW